MIDDINDNERRRMYYGIVFDFLALLKEAVVLALCTRIFRDNVQSAFFETFGFLWLFRGVCSRNKWTLSHWHFISVFPLKFRKQSFPRKFWNILEYSNPSFLFLRYQFHCFTPWKKYAVKWFRSSPEYQESDLSYLHRDLPRNTLETEISTPQSYLARKRIQPLLPANTHSSRLRKVLNYGQRKLKTSSIHCSLLSTFLFVEVHKSPLLAKLILSAGIVNKERQIKLWEWTML